jgi:unsaturated rhamnogalacturonyl hydrolase
MPPRIMTDVVSRKSGSGAGAPRRLSLAMSESAISRWAPERVRWHYEDGFLLYAIQRIGLDSGRPDYLAFVRESMDRLLEADGRIRTYRLEELNLDQINPGKVLFPLFRETGDARYRNALALLRDQLDIQPRCRSGGFWHKQIYPDQMWLDGLYMAGPFYATYAVEFQEPDALEDVVHQIVLMEEKARDPASGLLFHAWDEARRQLWANPENGRSPCVWARGMGWYAMALVDILEVLPDSYSGRGPIAAVLGRLLSALPRFQDAASGLWYQVVDRGGMDGNYLEASASCMYVYSILKAVRLGYSAEDGVREAARKAYRGIQERFLAMDESGGVNLDGTCGGAGLGGTPYRDGSFAYYVGEKTRRNDPKGVAAFILASREMELDGQDAL